jgi:hypothetical protein
MPEWHQEERHKDALRGTTRKVWSICGLFKGEATLPLRLIPDRCLPLRRTAYRHLECSPHRDYGMRRLAYARLGEGEFQPVFRELWSDTAGRLRSL